MNKFLHDMQFIIMQLHFVTHFVNSFKLEAFSCTDTLVVSLKKD